MKRAFTLIELMVVISVIAILATIALFGFGKAQAGARDVQRAQMMNGIRTALERYYGDKGSYPVNPNKYLFPGDTVESTVCSNYFTSLITALSSDGYIDINNLIDPLNKQTIFLTTKGTGCGNSNYNLNTGWSTAPNYTNLTVCGFASRYIYVTSSTNIQYGYNSDGQSYKLCLGKESGGYQEFKSPQ